HAFGTDPKYPDPTAGRKPGAPQWQVIWPVTGPAPFETIVADATGGTVDSLHLTALRKAIEQPYPKTGPTRAAAKASAAALARLREQFRVMAGLRARAAVARLLGTGTPGQIEGIDRDTAGQLFHALAAQERRAVKAGQPVKPPEAFDSLRNHLQLPRGNLT